MNARTLEFRAAWLTASRMLGSLFLGVALGAAVNALTPFLTPWLRTTLAAVVTVAVISVGATWWGRSIARLTPFADDRRVGRYAAAMVAPSIVAIGLTLSVLEPMLVGRGVFRGLPVHLVYAIVFVPATLVVGGLGGLAIGLGARDASLSVRLMRRTGVAAAAAFLIVDWLMNALGWRVGGPDAARRATMVVVTALGATAAALSGGAAIGFVLGTLRGRQDSSAPLPGDR